MIRQSTLLRHCFLRRADVVLRGSGGPRDVDDVGVLLSRSRCSDSTRVVRRACSAHPDELWRNGD